MRTEKMISLDPVPGPAFAKFELGEIVVTPGAALRLDPKDVQNSIARHTRGDWGELEPDDRRENDERIEKGGPLASIYKDSRGTTFYILTESDRSATTVLLPEEY